MKRLLVGLIFLVILLGCFVGCENQILTAEEYKDEIKGWAEYCKEQFGQSVTSEEQAEEIMLNLKNANKDVSKLTAPTECSQLKNKVLEFTKFIDENYNDLVELASIVAEHTDMSSLSYDKIKKLQELQQSPYFTGSYWEELEQLYTTEGQSTQAPTEAPSATISTNTSYDEAQLNIWAKKYSSGVMNILCYSDGDAEGYTESAWTLLKEPLVSYIADDCNLWDKLKSNVGAWNYYRGGTPLLEEGEYSIQYEVVEEQEGQVVIRTTETVKAENMDEFIDEQVHCKYTLELVDGEYSCIQAECDEFFSLIEKYGVPMYNIDEESDAPIDDEEFEAMYGDEESQGEYTEKNNYTLTSIQPANCQIIQQSGTTIRIRPQYCALNCDYIQIKLPQNVQPDSKYTFTAEIYWNNYPMNGCAQDFTVKMNNNGNSITAVFQCTGLQLTQYGQAYDAFYVTYM